MASPIEMHFYVVKAPDGTYHVQNIVLGKLGQHLLYKLKGFHNVPS
jgi:hypothetical protein